MVTKELYDTTITDIRAFIDELNVMIREKNYDKWLKNLSEEYIKERSSAEFLAQTSQEPVLKRLNIQLKSLRDYFNYVVVPSRQNDRADDIEFIGFDKVKVFVIDKNRERLLLYYLEKRDNVWKIGIGR
jgi:hypothetical protein